MEQASHILAKLAAPGKRAKTEALLDAGEIVCAAWPRVVGKILARNTRPAKLVGGRLVVEVDDAIWQRNLFGMSKQILSKLERAIGSGLVTDLEFRIMPRRRDPDMARASSTLFDDASSIPDPFMRRLYIQSRRKVSA